MSENVELISDGEGIAVLGEPEAVAEFLDDEGLGSLETHALSAPKAARASGLAASGLRVGAEYMAGSGRWLRLTEESAAAVKKYGLTPTKNSGVKYAMIGSPGRSQEWIRVHDLASRYANPLALTSVAAFMQQQAMQQQMHQMTEYLRHIDAKVDKVLQSQTDAVLAKVVGVGMILDDALAMRESLGRISDITWSKVQGTEQTIAEAQAYAARKLGRIAEQLEEETDPGRIAAVVREERPELQLWLGILARTAGLLDAYSLLEMDRVLAGPPEEIDGHRIALAAARKDRREKLASVSESVLRQLHLKAQHADRKVLTSPIDGRRAVLASREAAAKINLFRDALGVERLEAEFEPTKWRRALGKKKDAALEAVAQRAGAARGAAESSWAMAAEKRRSITGGAVQFGAEASQKLGGLLRGRQARPKPYAPAPQETKAESFVPGGQYLDRSRIGDVAGTVVVVDVLRAFTTAAYAFAAGAQKILLVGTVEDALALKAKHPDWLLAGEDGGKRLAGFDFSNSPVEVAGAALAGKTLIQRTTAGTQGVLACKSANRVLATGLVTASATAQAAGAERPHYVVTGWWPGRKLAGNDDWWTAQLVERARVGEDLAAEETQEKIATSDEAAWTLSLGEGSVHSLDVEYALRTDLFDFAMEATPSDEGWVLRPVGD